MSATLNEEIVKAGTAIARAVGHEATAATQFREFNEKATLADPARLAWPSTLTMELALKTASPRELKEHYGFSDEEWDALRVSPVFIAELTAMCDLVKQEGMSFKLKARLQSEALLETQWRLIHGPSTEVPAAVKQRGIETVFRVAGYDNKEAGAAGVGSPLNIQINFGGAGPPRAVIEDQT